jgi:hypothetical protein
VAVGFARVAVGTRERRGCGSYPGGSDTRDRKDNVVDSEREKITNYGIRRLPIYVFVAGSTLNPIV